MRSLLRIFACWCGAALLSLPLVAQQLPDQMSPPRLVNDFAGLLDEAQRRSLEQKLADFDRETSTQITVVTVDDLDGYAPADYAQRLHDKWGVGRKGKDNGILILVKPSQPDSRGEAYISVGYGLEGVIPDITAGRILDQEMIPEFRRGSVYDGLDKATNVLMQLSRGEFTADQYAGRDEGGGVAVGLVAILVLFFLFAAGRKGGGQLGGTGRLRGGGGCPLPPMSLGGGSRGGGKRKEKHQNRYQPDGDSAAFVSTGILIGREFPAGKLHQYVRRLVQPVINASPAKLRDHLLIQNPPGGNIRDHPFQAVSHRNVGFAPGIGLRRLDQNQNPVILAFASDSPLVVQPLRIVGRSVTVQIVHRNDGNLRRSLAVEIRQLLFQRPALRLVEQSGEIVDQARRRHLIGQLLRDERQRKQSRAAPAGKDP